MEENRGEKNPRKTLDTYRPLVGGGGGFRVLGRGLVRAPSQAVDQVPTFRAVLLLERLPELGAVAGLERNEPHDRMYGRLAVRPGHEETERSEPLGGRRVRPPPPAAGPKYDDDRR